MPDIVQTFIAFSPAAKAGLFFVLGACVGSFANVLFYRLPRGQEWVKTRSACPACGHTLGALDLIPVVSWLALRGRCRYCHAPVSARYPIIEAAFGGAASLLSLLIF